MGLLQGLQQQAAGDFIDDDFVEAFGRLPVSTTPRYINGVSCMSRHACMPWVCLL
jgi:hypothetical protein